MSRVDFAASRKSAERDGFIKGGDYFKFKEGANRIRLLTDCLPYRGEYKGTPNFKWLCYVLDREDGAVKTFFMPHTIHKDIESLQQTEDYAFEEVPMPYDIIVNAKNAGTKEVEYTTMAARKNVELSPSELAALAEKKPIEEVKAALRAKQAETAETAETHESAPSFDPDDVVPF